MTLTLNSAKQPFNKTLRLSWLPKNSSSEHIIETFMISLYEPKLSYHDLDLKDSNPFFAHDTLAYNDVSPYWVWLQKVQQFILSKLTLIEIFNLGCDIDLEHSNPVFSLDT